MKIQEGFEKARAAGTKARERVVETAPGAFIKVFNLIGGIAAFWWLLATAHDWWSNRSSSTPKVVTQVAPSGGNVTPEVTEQAVQGGNKAAEVVTEFTTTAADAASKVAEQFPIDEAMLIATGIIAVLILGITAWKKPSWLWPVLFFGLVIVLGYFWTPIEALVTEWLPASKAGMALGITSEDIGVWLWVFVTAVIVMAALALLPGALGVFGRLANITVIAMAVVALAIVNLTHMNPVEWASSMNQTTSKGGVCTTHKKSLDYRFDEIGKGITVCPDERYFFLYQGNNHPLAFEISPDFMKEKGHLFRNKYDWQDCFTVIPPEEGNSQQGSYRVIPKKGYGSCFEKRNISKIDIHVYAVM